MKTLGDPLVQGPRLSLSQDADMLERMAHSDKCKCEHVVAMEEGEAEIDDADKEQDEEDVNDGDTEFSFEFSSSVGLDLCPQEHKMLSAEELFFNGKLRPLQTAGSAFDQNGEELPQLSMEFLSYEEKEAMERGSKVKEIIFKESSATAEIIHGRKESEKAMNLHMNLPMVRTSLHESLALAKEHLRSLHESPRCLSMTIEGSRGHPRRSCVSLNNSRCSSPSRSRPSGAFSQPPTTPTSPKAHSSHKNSKFLHFFKLKKHLPSNKDALFPSSESSSSSGSRLSRAFWPFSRSNSAGESKSSHGVSPLPRRSNSAGESKTTSSALLPINPLRHDGESKDHTTVSLMLSARKLQVVQSNHQQADKKGLPPLPSANSKKTSSCFVPTNCGSDSVALSQPVADATPCNPAPTSRSSLSSTSTSSPSLSHASEEVSYVSRTQSSPLQNGEGDHSTHTHTHTQSTSSIPTEFKASASPGRHVRHASATNPVRSINRGSPARQWSNPNMGGSTRGSLQRFGPAPPRALMRPKDALSRETVSVRVTPVLNVPVCMTPSSKSKLFNLGNLFSKKEKVARGYTMLVSTDSQSGG